MSRASPVQTAPRVSARVGSSRLDDVIHAVIEGAVGEAGLRPSEQDRMALFVGSSSFDISVSESLYRRRSLPAAIAFALRSSSFGNLAEAVRGAIRLAGEDYTFNTACSASANGAWYAARMIQTGAIDHALVLGVELINDLTALGFFGLGLLAVDDAALRCPSRRLALGEGLQRAGARTGRSRAGFTFGAARTSATPTAAWSPRTPTGPRWPR